MFDWLFNFSAHQFAEGRIGFEVGSQALIFASLAALLIAGLLVTYRFTRLYAKERTKAISFALRVAAIAVLCLPLFEPVLITPDVVPDENFVAVLVDGSESMTIPDGSLGETRREDVQHILFDDDDGIVEDLAEHFQLRYYTFSEDAARVDSIQHTSNDGRGTNLSAALDRMLTDFRGIPLAGIVLLTDGGDNSSDIPLNKAEQLRNADVPIHVVGVGRTSFEQEREILDVSVTKAVEETTGAEIDVKVRSWVNEKGPVDFNIFRGQELVFSEKRRLKGSGKIDQLSFFFEPQQRGASKYRIEIGVADGEFNDANNKLEMLIDTRTDTMRVLYFEGFLRPDFKFIKRALEDDQVVDFVSVSRTGTGKYYRQGIRNPTELAGGFPATEAELFNFKAIVFGDVEASAFSIAQLRMVEQFVRLRGGGFLMLGGRNSFADGGYWNTPIEELLPITLDPSRRTAIPPRFTRDDTPPEEQGYKFVPTSDGIESPILKLSPDPRANMARWAAMPGLTSINYLGSIKPGAIVLGEKRKDDFGEGEPLLITQRYGKGRAAALATASTWRWQMLLDSDDARHERFWRQLVRWQVASAPDRVNVALSGGPAEPGREADLVVNVYDPGFRPLESASVLGEITDPFGTTREVVFQEELAQPGFYAASFVPRDEGVYRVTAYADQRGDRIGTDVQSFLVRSSRKEFHDATMKEPFLRGLADASGGFYYASANTKSIVDALRTRRTKTTVYNAESLWDMPFLFGLALMLLCAEWFYRRRKGLP